MKAIETRYKGYRFRSRLEARYAVFFDALGWIWEYEKEGFNLDGSLYLPDYYLPDKQTWIEVKGKKPTSAEEELCRSLCLHTKQSVGLCFGLPEFQISDSGKQIVWSNSALVHFCPVDEKWLENMRIDSTKHGGIEALRMAEKFGGRIFGTWKFTFGFSLSEINKAVNAAKSARFEHGETP